MYEYLYDDDKENIRHFIFPIGTSVPQGATPDPTAPTHVAFPDRRAQQQAMVVAFAAETGLPFAQIPLLIDFAKELARDEKALAKLSMDRTTASYKLKYGLSKTFKEDLNKELNEELFSLNIDEATSNNRKKVII